MPNMNSILRAPAGLRYANGACETIDQEKRQSVDSHATSSYTSGGAPSPLVKGADDPIWQPPRLFGTWTIGEPVYLASVDTKDAIDNDTRPKAALGIARLILTAAAAIIAAPIALFGGGCVFDTSGLDVEPSDGSIPDADIDGGLPDAEAPDAELPDSTVQTDADVPVGEAPQLSANWPIPGGLNGAPNNAAYVRWSAPSSTPPGKTVADYEVRWTTDGTTFDSKSVPWGFDFTYINTPLTNATYQISVRARYNEGGTSQWSAAKPYDTDYGSTEAVYRLDKGLPDGWWDTIYDSSGNGYNGVLFGCDPSTAWVAGGFYLNGTTCYGNMDDPLFPGTRFDYSVNQPFSMVARMSRSSVGSCATVFGKQDRLNNTTFKGYAFAYRATNDLSIAVSSNWGTGDYIRRVTNSQYSTPDVVQSLAGTYDGSKFAAGIKIYIDGVEVPSTSIGADELSGTATITNSAPSRLAASIPDTGQVEDSYCGLVGMYYYFAIYDRLLDGSHVANETCVMDTIDAERTGDPSLLSPVCSP